RRAPQPLPRSPGKLMHNGATDSVRSPPPCGEGLGAGVMPNDEFMPHRATPLPTPPPPQVGPARLAHDNAQPGQARVALGREQTEFAARAGRMLDELAAGDLLDRIGITRAPAVALDAGIAQVPPLPFPYPVAVKVLSADIAHKTDIGGVV